jgi:hypothetical protein
MPPTDAIFVITLVISVCTVIGAGIFTRHRERMTMIEKGMKAEDLKPFFEKSNRPWNPMNVRPWSPLSSLKWGIFMFAVGTAICLGLWLEDAYGMQGGVFPALILIFGGLALVVFYLIASRKERKEQV